MKHYWSEPEKIEWAWFVHRTDSETGLILESKQFQSQTAAWNFLKTIHVYINDVLCYSGL